MNSTEKLIVTFAAGAGLGALLGILFAPAKGSETRQRIKDGVDQCCEKVGDMVDDFKDAVIRKNDHIDEEA